MAHYCVTGGAGFIGSHLVDALLKCGHSAVVLDDFSSGREENVPAGATLIKGCITDPATVAKAVAGSDGVFHLAAIASVSRSNEEWLACHRVNQSGSVAVFEAAAASGRVPVVYASSAAVYGAIEGEIAREEAPPRPLTAYGADKLGSELHAHVGFVVHGVPSIGCRFFNVYGPRQLPSSPYSGVISIFAQRLLRGLPLAIHGTGEQMRDFIFVSDVVRHLQRAMDCLSTAKLEDVINVCTGSGTTIRQLAGVMAEICGQSLRIDFGSARPGDIYRSLGAPKRARDRLGLSAGVPLRTGLEKTIAWMRISA